MKEKIKTLSVSGAGFYEFTENEIVSNINFLHEIKDGTLRLYDEAGTFISSNGNVVHCAGGTCGSIIQTSTNGRSIAIINGRIFVNGKEVTPEPQKPEPSEGKGSKTLSIQELIFSLSSIMISGAATLKTNGKFLADRLNVSASGSSELSIKNTKLSNLVINGCGASEIRIKDAEIASATANASGSSDIRFKDSEIGEIDINGSGSSEIKGKNTRVGKISKNLSGTSEVKFKQPS